MLKDNYRKALVSLQQQDALQREMLDLDTSTNDGRARRDAIQSEMTTSCFISDQNLKECGLIHRLVADDDTLTIADLTEERLNDAIGT